MRLLHRFALLTGFAAVLAAPAAATTIAPLSLDQMTDASDLVVRGTVESLWVDTDDHGHVWTRALVRVDLALKGGTTPGDYVTVESAGGVLEGSSALVSGAARYSVGEDTLLFLSERPAHEAYGTVAMAGGKFSVRPNPTDGKDMVVRFTVPQDQPYDARFIPHPPAHLRTSFESVEGQIRARVALGWDGQPIPGISAERLRSINKLQSGVR